MAAPLLTTKLYVPPPRPRERIVPRPHLIERLDQGLRLGHRLILVSAPAGFGKTTLLSEWVGGRESRARVAWLSLDEGDNDPGRFLTYLIAALQRIQAGIGESVLAALAAPQSPPIEALLTVFINEVAQAKETVLLVLDDYHLIKARPIHDALTFLLDHLPPSLHLAIASRTDPPLPLPRLRARGQVTEICAADLRFTPAETAAFLNQVMGLGLSGQDVAALEARTEGWIAGLQLAAISMQGQADVSGFIAAFTGSNRYILDYLVEEILRRQPEDVQRFLLQTSVLNRLTGPLCDALTGRSDGQATLEMLEQANLFIVPLDQDRTWYRYHHLFAEFLHNRLRQAPPPALAGGAADLHCRASEWYERQGLLAEAVAHALDAQSFERAARLIELTARDALLRSETSTLLGWVEALPEEIIHARPHVCLVHAWALMVAGQVDAAELRAGEASQAISAGDAGVQGEVAAIFCLIAALRGDAPRAIELARQALERLPADDLFLRGLTAQNLGMAYEMGGDMAAAGQAYSEADAIGQAAGNIMVSLMAVSQLADLKTLQGHLHQAADLYRQAIGLATEPGRQLPLAGMAYLGMGQLLYEWNDLDAATRHLNTCIELGRQWASADMLVTGAIHLARVKQAQGDPDGARDLIQQAEGALQGYFVAHLTVGATKAYQARLWLRLGKIGAAARWAQDYQAHPVDESVYLHQIEATTLARVLMAQGEPEPVIDLLDPLLGAADARGQTRNVIELLALQALALEAQNKSTQAMTTVRRALTLAEPEGYVRTFVDEGEPMARLLRQAASRNITPAYVQKLLAAFGVREAEPAEALPQASPLVEPLSPRELEVLRLLAGGLANKEIAQTLVIAAGTVKQHLKSIYGKLEVHNRTEAANRARELGLL